jgi:hypothetical protein
MQVVIPDCGGRVMDVALAGDAVVVDLGGDDVHGNRRWGRREVIAVRRQALLGALHLLLAAKAF